ncbi:MAG: hypothetical protein HYW22_01475 [Candidatus Aenigmarchaeota archaeon]|nr:hypothetical protein [Candidatus Aenigmarchaeota archaeon]
MTSYTAMYHCKDLETGFCWARDVELGATDLTAALKEAQMRGRYDDDEDFYRIELVQVKEVTRPAYNKLR